MDEERTLQILREMERFINIYGEILPPYTFLVPFFSLFLRSIILSFMQNLTAGIFILANSRLKTDIYAFVQSLNTEECTRKGAEEIHFFSSCIHKNLILHKNYIININVSLLPSYHQYNSTIFSFSL